MNYANREKNQALPERVWNTIESYGMIRPGDRVIAGVSGGADSTCLLAILAGYRSRCPYELSVVHVEHGIRGEDSLADARFVEKLCEAWEVPCVVERVDVRARARRTGQTLEEAGRQVRYECFEREAERTGADRIAVAHNRNDQAETVLLNLSRGSGVRGLGGIRPVRESLIRPLLFTGREEIEEWLREEGIPFCTDATNLKTDYTRNRIRLEILPLLEEGVNREAVLHLSECAIHLQRAEDYLRRQAERAWERCGRPSDLGLELVLAPFLEEEELIREYVLRLCVERVLEGRGLKDYTAGHIRQLERLARMDCGKRMDFPGGLQAVRRNGILLFRKKNPAEKNKTARETPVPEGGRMKSGETLSRETQNAEEARREAQGERKEEQPLEAQSARGGNLCAKRPVALEGSGIYAFGGQRFRVEFAHAGGEAVNGSDSPEKKGKIPEKKYTKWLAYDTIADITGKICLRTRQAGDYLVVDQAGGRKKLKDYLIDQKIPREERDGLVLAAQGSHILWVVGLRISEAAKITESTEKILKIQRMED